MNKLDARDRDKRLWKTLTVGGQEFRIYYVYYEDDQTSCPDLPDFTAEPRYTADGSPFVLPVDEACEYGEVPGSKEACEDCAACKHLCLERSGDPIGVCLNEKCRMPRSNRTDETEEKV